MNLKLATAAVALAKMGLTASHWLLEPTCRKQDQLHAARYAQLFKNSEQVIPYRVFAQIELDGDFLVPHGNARH